MTKEFFMIQINRLRAEYSEKAYGEQRVKVIWEWAKRLNQNLFEQAVSESIGNCSTAPMKFKLAEFYSEVRAKNPGVRTRIECVYCDGYGWIPDDKPLPSVYRCRCQAGNQMLATVAQWKGELKRITPTKSELNWRNVGKVINQTFNKGAV